MLGVELKETLCGSVDAIVHEAFDSRVQKVVGSILIGCSGIIESAVWWCNKKPSSGVKIGSIVKGIADLYVKKRTVNQ